MKTVEYTHMELNHDYQALAGHYTPLKEVRLPYHGREVLYIVNATNVDASCCGTARFNAVLVPGYVIKWKTGKNQVGLQVSEVEPVTDPQVKEKIREIILKNENSQQIEFW